MRKNILIWVACTVAAFGLNGCASDDAPEKSEERNTEGISFEIPAESQSASAKASRTGGVKLSDRLKFVWSETDFNYLWCDVNQQGTTANWQKPTMQYTLSRDNANPAQLTSVSFVYQQLMPLVKRQNESDYNSPTSLFNKGYYTLLYTGGSSSPTKVNIRSVQNQTGTAGYADKLGDNGDCFVTYAAALWGNQTQSYDSNLGMWTYTYKRYRVYVGDNVSGEKVLNSTYQPYSHGIYYTTGHKASYITFLVYNSTGALPATYITQVSVTVGNQSINGELNFSVNGIDLSTRPNTVANKTTALNITDGLSIAGNATDAQQKAAVMVALPGEYQNVQVTVRLKDSATGIIRNVNRSYLKLKLEEGKNVPLPIKID